MADTTFNITNTGLIELLKKSYISDGQKKELEPLIPEMTEAERKELLTLIEQSKAEGEKVEKEYQENVKILNKEYMGKMDKLTKEQTEQARGDLEKMDITNTNDELKKIEGEIAVTTTATPISEGPSKTIKSHALRNITLILLILLLLAGGTLYLLNSL